VSFCKKASRLRRLFRIRIRIALNPRRAHALKQACFSAKTCGRFAARRVG
jgi:hypothetical protein